MNGPACLGYVAMPVRVSLALWDRVGWEFAVRRPNAHRN